MPSLIESLTSLLTEDGHSAAFGALVGGDADMVDVAGPTTMASIVDGLASMTEQEGGPEEVAALVDRHDAPLAEEVPAGTK